MKLFLYALLLTLFLSLNQTSGENISYDLIVSIYGNDDYSGTEKKPLRTIQKAIGIAKPGNYILIKKGVYNEVIKIKNSGTKGKPITIKGALSTDGNFKTIIDPSIKISGWVLAPEIGTLIFKKKLDFNPGELTIDGKRVCRINDNLMKNGKGFKLLTTAPEEEIFLPGGSRKKIKFWDGIEVLYGYVDGFIFIRFRGGDDPNNKKINVSDKDSAITLMNSSNIVLKDIMVKGAYQAIKISGTESAYNTIENMKLINGYCRIRIEKGAHNNTIRNNELTMDYYAADYLGAGSTTGTYPELIKRYLYYIFKYTVGTGVSNDFGIFMINSGSNNIIEYNEIYNGLVGIRGYTKKPHPRSEGLIIRNNKIYNMSSVGITSDQGISSEIYNNYIYNCNITIRMHNINSPEDLGRHVYIYNNKFSNPHHLGLPFYVYNSNGKKESSVEPFYYIYHNTLAGGRDFFGISDHVIQSGGMKNFYIVNNMISVKTPVNTNLNVLLQNKKIGLFANNWISGNFSDKSLSTFSNFGMSNQLHKIKLKSFKGTPPENVFGGYNLSKPFLDSNKILPGMKDVYSDTNKIPIGIIN